MVFKNFVEQVEVKEARRLGHSLLITQREGRRNENLWDLQVLDTGNNRADSPGEGKTPVAVL